MDDLPALRLIWIKGRALARLDRARSARRQKRRLCNSTRRRAANVLPSGASQANQSVGQPAGPDTLAQSLTSRLASTAAVRNDNSVAGRVEGARRLTPAQGGAGPERRNPVTPGCRGKGSRFDEPLIASANQSNAVARSERDWTHGGNSKKPRTMPGPNRATSLSAASSAEFWELAHAHCGGHQNGGGGDGEGGWSRLGLGQKSGSRTPR